MKCHICGHDIKENHDSKQCSCCSSKNCSCSKCPNCGYQNLSEVSEFNFKLKIGIVSRIKKLKKQIMR